MNLDPRTFAVDARLKNVKKIYAVSGFKGGVGKSTAACLLALAAAEKGLKTGLLDLDFSGSSCHIILGVKPGPKNFFPSEVKGLKPPEVSGIKFMSLAFFTQNRAAHLRGEDITNSIIELLAVTNWGDLDVLFLDMPPGISDAALDVMKLLPRAEIIAVLTPSVLSKDLAARALKFSKESGVKIAKIIENFSSKKGLPYDKNFEAALGSVKKLKQTAVYAALKKRFNLLP